MHISETPPAASPATAVLSDCPQCNGPLAILRVIAGKAGAEYWTLRCIRCGGIHLDTIKTSPASRTS